MRSRFTTRRPPGPTTRHLILAHDLGPERNREIFDYYATQVPRRRFWRFDRAKALAAVKAIKAGRALKEDEDFLTEIDVQAEEANLK